MDGECDVQATTVPVPQAARRTATKVAKESEVVATPTPAATAPQTEEHPDQSDRLLASVDATTRRVFTLMPPDQAVTPDRLAAEGIDIGDVITALTLLEIVGLVNALPGGMYIRR